MTLTTGMRLGPYEIVAPAGAGGMGEVYKARDTRLERTVALKVLPALAADEPELRARFEREARLVGGLHHPHICVLHDVGEHEGREFLVLEFLEGETVQERLARGPLPIDQVLLRAMEMADALDSAHRQGVVHRDLKPGNVMLTKTGATLLDFGLAIRYRKTGSAIVDSTLTTEAKPLTQEGTLLGTFQYMAPEQLEGKPVDARTDIFALGVLIYEMATGRRAFAGQSPASLIAAILGSEPPSLRSLQPIAPAALDRAVSRCLAKDPEERWQSARDLFLELRETRTEFPAAAQTLGNRRWGWPGAMAGAVAGALVVGSLHFLARPRPETGPVRLSLPPPAGVEFVWGQVPAVSPDGRLLALVGRSKGETRLWLRALAQDTARALAGTEGASFPFWSPDSRTLGFFAEGQLKRVEVSGGLPRILGDAPSGRGGTWSREGVIVFAPIWSGALHRISAEGGTSKPLTSLDPSRGESAHRWPQFLPDGRHFLYFALATLPGGRGVRGGTLPAGDLGMVLRTDSAAVYAPGGYLLFVRDHTLLAQRFDPRGVKLEGEPLPLAAHAETAAAMYSGVLSASDTGVLVFGAEGSQDFQLAWLSRRGERVPIPGPRGGMADMALSPDGRSAALALMAPSADWDVWRVDLEQGIASRVTSDPAADRSPIWSRDGQRLVFSSNRPAAAGLYLKSASGEGKEELLEHADSLLIALDWSPDGRSLLYARSSAKGDNDLMVRNLSGDARAAPFLETEFDEAHARFSPDGRWVAYVSDESGGSEVYVASFPDAARRQRISTAGGIGPAWRRDGQELFYLGPDGTVLSVPVDQSGRDGIVRGPAQALFRITHDNPAFSYAVAPDGQRFLMTVPAPEVASSPLNVILDWPSLLGK